MRKQILALLFTFVVVLICSQIESLGNKTTFPLLSPNETIGDGITPIDTIELFLEDSLYYTHKDVKKLMIEFESNTGYLKYFISTSGLEYELRDSLPDGFYCLYGISSKQKNMMNDKRKYLVASGEYLNGLKEGKFIFLSCEENDLWTKSYKEITFKNGHVDGTVKEYEGELLLYAGEYRLGKRNGFRYFWNNGAPAIFFFSDDVLIDEAHF